MPRGLTKTLSLFLLTTLSAWGLYLYHEHTSLTGQIHKLEEQKKELENIVGRLTAERRVAEVLVTEQKRVDGVLHSTLLFVEYARDGKSLPPKRFDIAGDIGHIDAMVIKFDKDFVKAGDPLKGHSIVLFTKIYGDKQAPADAPSIDTPGTIPDIYKGQDPKVSEFEQDLWNNFWRLTTDEAYRKQKGVEVAMGQGYWDKFDTDTLYTITAEAAGSLSIRREPLKSIYKEALRQPKA